MSALEQLLAVQDIDTVIDQLRHRRATLPERLALKETESRRKELAPEAAAARQLRDEVAARQATLEKDIAASEDRIAQIDKRMYSGEVSASRDLQAMSDEIASIKRRVSTLEDAALEAMDEREPLDAAVADFEARDATLVAEAARLREAIAAAEAEIDGELEVEQRKRAEAATAVADELLATYERLRTRLGGIGAARLEHGTCMGCRLRLPATEIDRLKREPPDALVYCDQCGRILVR